MTATESLFDVIGISYSEFRGLDGEGRMRYVRDYARSRMGPGERLWWLDAASLESEHSEPTHTLPIQARLYKTLSQDEKRRLRAEAAILCPSIVQSSRTRTKYDDVALFLLTVHGVIAPQTRDLFSAGSVAHRQSDERGGLYVQRALMDIETEMREAALRLDEELFLEYWGYTVAPHLRIREWLKQADELARDWVPSDELFLD